MIDAELAAPRPTTIVQISDTHVTEVGRLAYGRADTAAGLALTVAHVRGLPERIGPIDAVVISGDLTDLGTDAEYARFRELTADLPGPVYLLPGNHDRRDALRRAYPEAAHLPPGDGPLDYVVEAGALTLIALDTTVSGAAHGALSDAQLAWLEQCLAASAARPTMIFAHHPPFDCGIPHMDAQRLRNGEALIARVAGRAQVKLIATGHVHRWISTVIQGAPCMIAPAPTHAVSLDLRSDQPPHFHLEPGGVVVHQWTPTANAAFGVLRSQLSHIDPGPGPFPFFADGAPIV